MTKKIYTFADGKYEIIRNDQDYSDIEFFRHGESWNYNVTGNKLFHLMLDEIERLKEFEFMYKGLE